MFNGKPVSVPMPNILTAGKTAIARPTIVFTALTLKSISLLRVTALAPSNNGGIRKGAVNSGVLRGSLGAQP